MKLASILTSSVLGGLVFFGSQSAHADGPAKLPLVTFYSAARADFFTTSNPAWTCVYFKTCAGGPNTPLPEGGYVIIGLQGHVWNPDNPQPASTNTLYQWFSPARGDNFVTANPVWAGSPGSTREGYFFVRREGYIAQTGAGTALKNHWNPGEEDNAALATWRASSPAGWDYFRIEGFLLPPENYSCSGTPNHTEPSWLARANFVELWNPQSGLIDHDRFRFTAPADWFRTDYWPDHWHPVRGYSWQFAGGDHPAPGLVTMSLITRVTSGAAFTSTGWYEAGEWFQALGSQSDWDGACIYYESRGVPVGNVEVRINDPNIGDNGGGANLTMKHWW